MSWFAEHAQTNFEQFVPDTPLRVLQIGVWTGDATGWLLANREVEAIVDVDPWTGDQGVRYGEAERSYDRDFGNHPLVEKVKSTSDSFFVSNDRMFNFVYVDGDHQPDQVFRDGINGWGVLEEGGLLAFDDYGWVSRGVQPGIGIDLFLNTVDPDIVHKGYQVWVRK